jgi:hypothetical protein
VITYNSSLRRAPPITDAMRASAKEDMLRKSPFRYPSQHQDILSALGQENYNNYLHAGEKANTEYELAQQNAQNELSLTGLRQMAEAQQQQQQLSSSRAGAAMSAYNGLLSGLFT